MHNPEAVDNEQNESLSGEEDNLCETDDLPLNQKGKSDIVKLTRKPIRTSSEAYNLKSKHSSKNMYNREVVDNEQNESLSGEEDNLCETDDLPHNQKGKNVYPDISAEKEEFLEKGSSKLRRRRGASTRNPKIVSDRRQRESESSSKRESVHDDDVKPDRSSGFNYFDLKGIFNSFNFKGIFIRLFGMISLVIYIIYFFFRESHHVSQPASAELVVENLKNKFTNQSELTFKQVKLAIHKVIKDGSEPKSPGILLLASSPGAEHSVVCFSKSLVSLLKAKKSVEIEGKNYEHHDAAVAKEELDAKIKETFNTEFFTLFHIFSKEDIKLNVLLVTNLNSIPADAAMVFHGYCDEANAPFKRSVIIMTVSSQNEIPTVLNIKAIDEYAIQVLRESWAVLPARQLESLLARLSVRVALILPDIAPC